MTLDEMEAIEARAARNERFRIADWLENHTQIPQRHDLAFGIRYGTHLKVDLGPGWQSPRTSIRALHIGGDRSLLVLDVSGNGTAWRALLKEGGKDTIDAGQHPVEADAKRACEVAARGLGWLP